MNMEPHMGVLPKIRGTFGGTYNEDCNSHVGGGLYWVPYSWKLIT